MKEDEKILILAKLLSEVHSFSLFPFYSDEESNFWNELEDNTYNNDEVDKTFFINIAKMILDEIK